MGDVLAMFATHRHRRAALRHALVIACIATLAVLLGVPAKAAALQQLDANRYGQIEFSTPSGNIGCVYTPAGGTPVYETWDGGAELSCDRVEPHYLRVILGEDGAAERFDANEIGDFGCCSLTQQLDYGFVAEFGPFQCLSDRKGLTCAREDGHGFFLSRALVEVR